MAGLPAKIDESGDTAPDHAMVRGMVPEKLLARTEFPLAVDCILSGDPDLGDQPVQFALLVTPFALLRALGGHSGLPLGIDLPLPVDPRSPHTRTCLGSRVINRERRSTFMSGVRCTI